MELDCLGPQGYVEVEKNRQLTLPMPVVPAPSRPGWQRLPAPPPQLTQCNVFRCYDRDGRSYSRP